MTRRPDDTEPEPLGGRAAERLRQSIDQRYPDGIPYSPLPEDAAEEEADVDTDEEEGPSTEQGEADVGHDLEPEPLGGHAAERLREFIDQRYPDGIPYSPLPEDAAKEEADVDADEEGEPSTEPAEADVDHGSEPEPLGGHAAERLREFIDQRYPDGIPYSPLPEDAGEEGADMDAGAEQGGADAGHDARQGTEQSEA